MEAMKSYELSPQATAALSELLRDEDFLADDPSDMLDDVLAFLSEVTDASEAEKVLKRELARMPRLARASLGRAIRAGLET